LIATGVACSGSDKPQFEAKTQATMHERATPAAPGGARAPKMGNKAKAVD